MLLIGIYSAFAVDCASVTPMIAKQMSCVYVCVAGPPGGADMVSSDSAAIGKEVTFTCVVNDPGNPKAHDYNWHISDDSWSCAVDSVNADVYHCIVSNDCNVTVSCTPSNSVGSGQTVILPVPVIGGMGSPKFQTILF